jgi:hypothetical protein
MVQVSDETVQAFKDAADAWQGAAALRDRSDMAEKYDTAEDLRRTIQDMVAEATGEPRFGRVVAVLIFTGAKAI